MEAKKLILFDIDGTLLQGGKVFRKAFHGAVSEVLEKEFQKRLSFQSSGFDFSGKTDLQICREFLNYFEIGSTHHETLSERIIETYLKKVRRDLQIEADAVQVLEGVESVLTKLHEEPHSKQFVSGLLTGNVEGGSKLKLESVNLLKFFRKKIGAWGSDHWDRKKLPFIAVQRARKVLGIEFEPRQVVVIGDTIHDVACGKHFGSVTVAVGTNPRVDQEQLKASKPDYYLESMKDTDQVMQILQRAD
jgi:phosphoglycolate phosphatase-like HAD superfamily hydrolase